MGGLYSIITRAPGTLITALIYNFDHQAHVDGRTATEMQSFATSLSQMTITADPLPNGVERLPVALSDELSVLRFVIAAVKTSLNGDVPVNWFDPVTSPGFASIGARMLRATAFSIPASTDTAINFTGATADFNSGVWVIGSPTRFTAPNSGLYAASASVSWDIGMGGIFNRRLSIGVNGSTSGEAIRSNSIPSGRIQRQTVSGLFKLAATDYIEFFAFQDTAVAMNLISEGASSIVGSLIFFGTAGA
jgi:hypothetical protein